MEEEISSSSFPLDGERHSIPMVFSEEQHEFSSVEVVREEAGQARFGENLYQAKHQSDIAERDFRGGGEL
jgi:hypothetical protein